MGILNVTPDSFSGDGLAHSLPDAIDRAMQLISDGADIIDIGGESTRPGAFPVSIGEELDRVIPVIAELRSRTAVPISIDTVRSGVAIEALAHGANIVNDVSGLRSDPIVARVAAEAGADLMVMGAYTRSKVRQLILGSVTGYVMKNATLPVLLCH